MKRLKDFVESILTCAVIILIVWLFTVNWLWGASVLGISVSLALAFKD